MNSQESYGQNDSIIKIEQHSSNEANSHGCDHKDDMQGDNNSADLENNYQHQLGHLESIEHRATYRNRNLKKEIQKYN